jgi:hypothetical protein
MRTHFMQSRNIGIAVAQDRPTCLVITISSVGDSRTSSTSFLYATPRMRIRAPRMDLARRLRSRQLARRCSEA